MLYDVGLICCSPLFFRQGFLGLKWAKWKRVLLTRSIAMVPCVILAVIAAKRLDFLDEFINVEQSMLVSTCRNLCIFYYCICFFAASVFSPSHFVFNQFKQNNEEP